MTKSVFAYRNGVLCAEALPLVEIAEEVDTPFHCTSAKQLQRNCRELMAPLAAINAMVYYPVATNSSLAVIQILAQAGAGVRVSCAGEIERALEAGVRPERIVLSGAAKTREDIAAALLSGVSQMSAESMSELQLIADVAEMLGLPAPISLMIQTQVLEKGKISFGLDFEQIGPALAKIQSNESLIFKGLTVHVSHEGDNSETCLAAYKKVALIVGMMRDSGLSVETLYLGSGLGLLNRNENSKTFSDRVAFIREAIAPLGCALAVEADHLLVGDASVLVARVVQVKQEQEVKLIVLDINKRDFSCLFIEESPFDIISVFDSAHNGGNEKVTILGSLCDQSEVFGSDYAMPNPKVGDLVAIMNVGVYGGSLALSANGRAIIPEVLVSGAQQAVIRRRVSAAEQIVWETIPDWMVINRAA